MIEKNVDLWVSFGGGGTLETVALYMNIAQVYYIHFALD